MVRERGLSGGRKRLAKKISRHLWPYVAAMALAGCATTASADDERLTVLMEKPLQIVSVVYSAGPGWIAGRPMAEQDLRPHAAYMKALLDRGKLFAAGGFLDAEGGMALLMVADRAEAEALVAADPAVTSGVFIATLNAWQPRFASGDALPR